MKLLPFTSFLAGTLLAFNLVAQTTNTQELVVTVQDPAGKPIAGATLESYVLAPAPTGVFATELQQTAITGQDGIAKLTTISNIFQFLVRKPGMAIVHEVCLPNEGAATVTLGKPEVIAGVVVDEADKPVANAEISVASVSVSLRRNAVASGELLSRYLNARTGEDGAFRIEGFPAGCAVDLAVKKKGKALVPNSRQSAGFDGLMCQAGQKDLKLRMQPGGKVEARVDIPGKAYKMSQVRVTLVGLSGRLRLPNVGQLGADGVFRFEDLVAGDYLLNATFENGGMSEWVTPLQNVSVASGKPLAVTLNAVKGGILQVATFSSAEHKPIGGASFQCNHQYVQTFLVAGKGTTDENGLGFMRLAPGEYHISANHSQSAAKGTNVTIKDGETNRVELELVPPHLFRGTVRDSSGIPAAGSEVALFSHGPGESFKSDAAGRYLVGTYNLDTSQSSTPFLMARDRKRNLVATREIEDGTNTYDLQLAPASVISGRVEDQHGGPVTNAVVTLMLRNGSSGSPIDYYLPTIDAQGRFEIPALPLGREYTLYVRAKGYGTADRQIEALNTNRLMLETITLKRVD